VAMAEVKKKQEDAKGGRGKGRGGKGGRGGDRKQPPKLKARAAVGKPGKPPKPENVQLHPCSVNFDCMDFESRWLVYHEKVETSAVFLRDATMVTPYPLLLFGGEISVQHSAHTVKLDRWIEFEMDARVGVQFRALRGLLDNLLLRKVQDPGLDVWKEGGPLIDAVVQVLSNEGVKR